MNKTLSYISIWACILIAGMGCSEQPVPTVQSSIDLNTAMSGDTTGYERAIGVRDLTFPDDFGPHPSFKTEWWYFTGNVDDEEGRRFGYELTLFRSALSPDRVQEDLSDSSLLVGADSGWSSSQLYMGHFSLANVDGFATNEDPAFYAFERFGRGAKGLAGAQATPFRVWLDHWSADGSGDGLFPIRVRAEEDGIAIDLTLSSSKPIVLQGDKGFDQKGAGVGNASYYYSFTRMNTEGTIRINDQSTSVTGYSWKDHEWSTSALDDNQEGWDWFALQLSDNREIMFYVIRESGGSMGAFINGTLVEADGTTTSLKKEDVLLEVTDTWKSPHSGATYPSGWVLQVPAYGIDLAIQPLLKDQELNVSVRYWEGAVSIDGKNGLTGRGYVELTGYR